MLDDEAKIRFYEDFDRQRPKRAAFWALQRACGRTVTQIAKKSEVSEALVKQEIRWAARQGHFDRAQDRLFQLLDKAVTVYEQALTDRSTVIGDKDVARDLLNGAGVLGKHLAITQPGDGGGERETFEVWRARFSRPAHQASLASGGPDDLSGHHPADPSPIIDAEPAPTPGAEGDEPVVEGFEGPDDTKPAHSGSD